MLHTPGDAWGRMSAQEVAEPDGTPWGDCVGWSVVFSILPGDSPWEEARLEPGSKIAIKWGGGSQKFGCRAHTLSPFSLDISRGTEQAPL